MTAKKISEIAPSLVDLDLYNHIELTEEEIKMALFEARLKKDGQIKLSEYAKKVNRTIEYITFTAEEVFEMVKHLPDFTLDEFNSEIILNLCYYFTGDARSPYEAKKGILMYGPVGCGKTTLMNFFRFNQVSSFAFIPTRTISYEYSKHGHESIQKYKGMLATSDVYKSFGQGNVGVCFDDLGTEVDKKFYGNESNVMAEILLNRYDNKNLAAKTHITTNLNGAQIEERYGLRVRSRCREMFNVVTFNEKSPDRRK